MTIRLKRAYDPPAADDGVRVLVDRLWPRGVRKAEAALDDWMKEVAPSKDLRTWFGHDPERWEAFRRKYERELESHPQEVEALLEKARRGPLTLIYAAKDTEHNDAVVLRGYLLRRAGEG